MIVTVVVRCASERTPLRERTNERTDTWRGQGGKEEKEEEEDRDADCRTWTGRGTRGTRHEEARERNSGSDILVIVVVV